MTKTFQNTYYAAGRTDRFSQLADFEPQSDTDHLTYFLKMFEEIERSGAVSGAVFVLGSYRNRELPAYGPNVFVFVHDDEHGRLIRYSGEVGAIFKAYGEAPSIARPWHVDRLQLLLTLRYLRSHALRAATRAGLLARGAGPTAGAPTFAIPAGYMNQIDLPVIPMGDRRFDVNFAGSISNGQASAHNLFGLLDTPKACSRRRMAAVLRHYMADNPSHNYHVFLTQGFNASTGSGPEAFSRNLADTRICLVPRGCHVETIRYFQAMRYGCVVICESLPDHWFYAGSPAIVVEDWAELPDHLDRLLRNPTMMADLSERALAWWRNMASEPAVARFVEGVASGLSLPRSGQAASRGMAGRLSADLVLPESGGRL